MTTFSFDWMGGRVAEGSGLESRTLWPFEPYTYEKSNAYAYANCADNGPPRALPGQIAGAAPPLCRPGGRIPFLDALRGLLACVVVAYHAHVAFGGTSLNGVARAAVLIFFAMSGYVLARAYDGRPLAFMARRLVRLWPPYALVLTIAYALHGQIVPLWVLAWWTPGSSAWPDPPAWSLFWEGWATFVLPLAFWVLARSRGAMLALAGASLGLSLVRPELVNVGFFALGVAGAGFAIPWPREVPTWCEWLGKISFSLYLSHAVVMKAAYDLAGPWAVLASLPIVFLVAWALWWGVERPSIAWSRRVGRA